MRPSAAILFALLVATVLAAQAPPGPQQPTFRAGINFVRVDVYPTLNGRPVADLNRDDFEVLEDGVAQRLDTFEHVVVRPRDITQERVEPRNVQEANREVADARHRVFVVFLDTYHVTDPAAWHGGDARMPGPTTPTGGAAHLGTPLRPDPKLINPNGIEVALTRFLDRAVGADDLFALVTPDLGVEQLSFTRRPDDFQEVLRRSWARRFSWDNLDPEEERWAICYPPDAFCNCYPGILVDMVRRHREALTLRALRQLVERLGDLRQERKALLLVSEGWALYRPDAQLARPLARIPDPPECRCPVVIPGGKGVYIGPGGQPKTGTDPRTFMTVDWQQCESARSTIAHSDNEQTYRQLVDVANRTNTTFYPIDPRGLAVFDTPMNYRDPNPAGVPQRLRTLPADQAVISDMTNLAERLESLRNLATATDGRTTETNDLAGGLKQIADDLSDYYLLGYYSTNAKTDGTFRKITVRVKRPGVQVRARRGYLAPTEAEIAARKAAAKALDPDVVARESALATLGTIRADRPFHFAAGLGWQAPPGTTSPRPTIWMEGELDVSAARERAWGSGADVVITVIAPDGSPVTSLQASLSSYARGFLKQIPAPQLAGEYLVRVKVQGSAGSGAEASDQARVVVPRSGGTPDAGAGQAMLFRRGPFSGPGFQPAVDLRFRRAERIRVDVPLTSPADSVSARVLDRNGEPLGVPASAVQRDENGMRLASSEVTLAPLTNGDYLIEVSIKRGSIQDKTLAAIRIVP